MSRKSLFVVALLVCLTTRSVVFGQQAKEGTTAGGSGTASAPAGGGGSVVLLDARAAAAAQIEAALRQPDILEFNETPLSKVVAFCAEKFDIDIQLDSKGLTDAAVDPQAPVRFSTRKPISFESALRLILEEFDLTFVVKDEVLMVTSKEKADEILTTKVYYVGDLVRRRHDATPSFGPLMNLITSTIQPDSWEDNGGPGSVQPFGGEFLVFSQKRDVHVEVAELFEKLREESKAHSHAVTTEKGELFTRLYSVGAAPGAQMADAVKKLVAPTTWKEQGGAGEICIVDRRGPAPVQIQGQPSAPTGDVLLIRQSPEVHDQIVEIMTSLNPFGGPRQFGGPMAGGMMGGVGNAGGGMGGGVKGAGGGGMFRVPASR